MIGVVPLRDGGPAAPPAPPLRPNGIRDRARLGIEVSEFRPSPPKERDRRLVGIELRAARRLRDLAAVLSGLHALGVPVSALCALQVAANALRALGGRWLATSEESLLAQLPADLRGALTARDLREALSAPAGSLMSAREAGQLIGLTAGLWDVLQRDGCSITSISPNESDVERAVRHRGLARVRQQRRRDRASRAVADPTPEHRNVAVNRVTPGNITKKRDAESATFRRGAAPARIVAALRGGPLDIANISAEAGVPVQSLRPWLSRLRRSGHVRPMGRGKYMLAAMEAVDD